MDRPVYFPPPWHIPEGTYHRWAVVRWRRGQGLRWVRTLPHGYGMILCRLGAHIMIDDMQRDARSCACGAWVIHNEQD